MTKRGDGPTTRRMGFGYHQARAAGAPPPRPERPVKKLNWELLKRQADRTIADSNIWLVENYHPNPKARALELRRLGYSAADIADQLMDEVSKEIERRNDEQDRLQREADEP